MSSCGGDDSDGGSDRGGDDEASTAPGCDADVADDVSDGEQVFEFEGEERAYLLAVPDDYDGETPHPLILSFHGFETDKESHEAEAALAERATDRGYLVATPAAGDSGEWSIMGEDPSDDDFVLMAALMTELGEDLCVDPDRIYAAGHSAGSLFAGLLGCREPYPFAATAMVGGFMPPSCGVESATPSVIAIHGTADPVVPYGGGELGAPASGPPMPAVMDTLGYYAEHYGCEEPASGEEAAPGIERRSLRYCTQDAEVVLYTIEDGGHVWPGGEDAEGFPATDTILDFFDGQSK